MQTVANLQKFYYREGFVWFCVQLCPSTEMLGFVPEEMLSKLSESLVSQNVTAMAVTEVSKQPLPSLRHNKHLVLENINPSTLLHSTPL